MKCAHQVISLIFKIVIKLEISLIWLYKFLSMSLGICVVLIVEVQEWTQMFRPIVHLEFTQTVYTNS
jgi:hypothetical protein